jgi:hypothetical protein
MCARSRASQRHDAWAMMYMMYKAFKIKYLDIGLTVTISVSV